jgi:hypothetical protein
LCKSQKVFAIRAGNYSGDFAMLQTLQFLRPQQPPILDWFLNDTDRMEHGYSGTLGALTDCDDLIDDVREAMLTEYRLNADQTTVLDACAAWLRLGTHASVPPVNLVHGTFGAGKSYLLVAVIIFLVRVLDAIDPKKTVRLLLAANTNVAVDNVLLGLQKRGFEDFARVGSVKKIAKPILKHTLHHSDTAKTYGDHDKRALEDLNRMLKEELNGNPKSKDAEDIRQAIKDLSIARPATRSKRLKTMRVVGTTCAATAYGALDDSKFSIVLLDEASQMLEPLSLLPISKFGCERLLAVGDPLQLPPTMLYEPPAPLPSAEKSSAALKGSVSDTTLRKTLFVRLTALGVKPILLRTQYRCHPEISRISNCLFYDDLLIDGVDASLRPPMLIADITATPESAATPIPLQALSPLTLINVNGQQSSQFGSIYNEAEVCAVRDVIAALFTQGIAPASIGVVTLYRNQAYKLKRAVDEVSVTYVSECDQEVYSGKSVQVSTVDAFQGAEKDIILLSTCFTSTHGGGFVDSPHRMNVALSRARHHLIVMGSLKAMNSGAAGTGAWKEVVNFALQKSKGGYFPSVPVFLSKLHTLQLNPALKDKVDDGEEATHHVRVESSYESDAEAEAGDEVMGTEAKGRAGSTREHQGGPPAPRRKPKVQASSSEDDAVDLTGDDADAGDEVATDAKPKAAEERVRQSLYPQRRRSTRCTSPSKDEDDKVPSDSDSDDDGWRSTPRPKPTQQTTTTPTPE